MSRFFSIREPFFEENALFRRTVRRGHQKRALSVYRHGWGTHRVGTDGVETPCYADKSVARCGPLTRQKSLKGFAP